MEVTKWTALRDQTLKFDLEDAACAPALFRQSFYAEQEKGGWVDMFDTTFGLRVRTEKTETNRDPSTSYLEIDYFFCR